MKAYRQNRKDHLSKPIRLLDHPAETHQSIGLVVQERAKAQIQDGRLLMRVQRIFMVPTYIKIPLPLQSYIFVCPHIRIQSPGVFYQLGIQIPCSDKVDKYKNIQGLIYCQHC